jgi:hypothetical protein
MVQARLPGAREGGGLARWVRRVLVAGWVAAASALLCAQPAAAHNLSYATLKASIAPDGSYELDLNFHVAALLMGQSQAHLDEDARQRWAALSEQDLDRLRAEAATYLRDTIEVYADGRPIFLDTLELPDAATLRADGLVPPEDARPSSPVIARGRLPAGTQTFSLAAPEDFTEVLLSVESAGGVAVIQVLRSGQRSQPFALDPAGARTVTIVVPAVLVTIWQYMVLGFEHILPKGLDHILFVLGLFFLTPQWRSLGWQVTAFTLAHSVTLALAVFGLIRIPPVIVEPLIAASIVAVAVDNMMSERLRRWRIAAVFGFGLLHGVGFAGVLRAMGLPLGGEAAALVSFNVGVELGQIAVLALAFLAVGWFRSRDWFRSRIAIPASAAIAGVGVFWTIERIVANL